MRAAPSILRCLLLLALAAATSLIGMSCDDEPLSPPLAVCVPILDDLSPSSGPLNGGTEVALQGLFITTELGVRDTRIQLDGQEADVLDVFRDTSCLACDQCILAALRCAECTRVCRGESGWTDVETGEWLVPEACVEQVDFVTPAGLSPGPAALILTTSRGSGVGLEFNYTAGDDDDSAGDDLGN